MTVHIINLFIREIVLLIVKACSNASGARPFFKHELHGIHLLPAVELDTINRVSVDFCTQLGIVVIDTDIK
ncbi:hypothetical protein D3C73_745970 [compost metagenome]